MATDARLGAADTNNGRAYPRPPRTIRLALLAAFVTAVLAGPVTAILFIAALATRGMPMPDLDDIEDLIEIGELLIYSSLFGLVGSIPAATINTFLLAFLARRRHDALGIAIASGATLGLLAGATIGVIEFLTEDRALMFAVSIGLPFLTTGGLMGALHWIIAIRPRRRWRLFQERERAALMAME